MDLDNALLRKANETDFEYHKRLLTSKLEDRTIDSDYSELSDYLYGKHYSSDVARRMAYGSMKTIKLIENSIMEPMSESDVFDSIESKINELNIAKQKFYDQRTAFNKIIRERSRQEELNEILVDAISNSDLPHLNYEPSYVEPSTNDLLVSLNDIHYGIDINNAWNTYNPDVCRDMMRKYLDRIIAIAQTHHSENCIVYNCGDSISGKIHLTIQITNKENVVEQIKGVSELIAEFLAELSSHFNTVKYVSVSGNHSRLDSKENSPYDERMDDLIEWYLAARLQDFENILIDTQSRMDATMFITDIRGKTYLGVHGDFDGSATKIAALQAMAQKPLYAILSGHKHHNMCDEAQGVKTIMAGSFLGVDDFCIQKRIFGKPEQMVCVCDNTGIICHYDIAL